MQGASTSVLPRLFVKNQHFSARFSQKVGVGVAAIAAVVLLSACDGRGSSSGENAPTSETTINQTTINRSTKAQPDSCAIFTHEQVAALVGNAVQRGTDTGAGQGCYFASVEDASVSMLVNLETGDSPAKFADSRSLATDQTSDVRSLSGIADEAFEYAPTAGGVVTAEARAGTLRVRIVLTGNEATTDTAQQALVAAVQRALQIMNP